MLAVALAATLDHEDKDPSKDGGEESNKVPSGVTIFRPLLCKREINFYFV